MENPKASSASTGRLDHDTGLPTSSAVRACVPCQWIAGGFGHLRKAVLRCVDWAIARPSMFWLNRRLLVLAQRGLGYHHCCDTERSGELRLIQRVARNNPKWCIDIGANIGHYSTALLASSAARVIAFEPLPAAYERLRELAARSGERFFPVHCGVGREVGELELRFSSDESVLASFSSAAEQVSYVDSKALRSHRVRITTLDAFLLGANAELRVDQIDLLKIDVEGFEYEVLQGAARVIEELRPLVIQIEYNWHQLFTGHSLLDFAKLLEDYSVWQLMPFGSGFRQIDPRQGASNTFAYANFAFVRRGHESLIVD
jgi:FkbM family methyltransferase